MKNIFLTLILALVSMIAWAHPNEESRITIEPEIQGSYNSGSIQYAFQLFDSQTKKTLSDKDLVETHTKLLHFIAYDSSRNEFNHEHPAFDGKVWSVALKFDVNGTYFFWAQGELHDGTKFSTFVNAQVINGKPEIPVVALSEKRKATVNLTTLTLDKTKLKAGSSAMVNFKITREDGLKPELTPYLGALAHVIAVSPDGDELIHVHPMAGSTPDTGMIHATFPSEGDYRIWVQLIDRGELKTIPLAVTVSK